MAKSQTIRFASGRPDEPFSGVWRLVVNKKDDVFIGASKAAMGLFKISLHKSVWVLAATEQSGATFEGNRRAKQWNRPLEHVRGVTRGPSILVPNSSFGSRPLPADEGKKKVVWFPGPAAGETVEFSLYFVEPGAATYWNPDQTVLAECPLARGKRVVLLASTRPSPLDFRGLLLGRLRRGGACVEDSATGRSDGRTTCPYCARRAAAPAPRRSRRAVAGRLKASTSGASRRSCLSSR
jgi:hypothetical protein